MLYNGVVVVHINIREGVRAARGTEQQRVAGRIVAGVVRLFRHAHQSAIRILAFTGRDTFGNNGGTRAGGKVNHLCTRVGLLVVVGDGHGVEFRLRTFAGENAGGVFPSDGAARFDLCPREAGVFAAQMTAFGHEVEHTAFAIGIARIPVLHGGILHLGIGIDHNLNDGGMELVFIAHGGGAAFEIRHVAALVANDEGALKLPSVARVDAEVGGEFHRTAHAFGDKDKRTIGEDSRVEGSEVVVAIGDNAAQVFAHEFGIFLDGFRKTAENDALLLKALFEGGLDAHRVHHGINGYSCQCHALVEGDAELVEGFHQLRVNLLLVVLLFRRVGIIRDGLVVDFGQTHVRPIGLRERLPVAKGGESELQQPFGFFLFGADLADDVFRQTGFDDFGLHVGNKSSFIFLLRKVA